MCFTTLTAAMLHGTPVISKCWRSLPNRYRNQIDSASLTNIRPQRTKKCDREKRNKERNKSEREGHSIIANKYLALNIILERNQNATVISTKPHEISYANMHGIFLANSSEKNLFQNEREKSVFFVWKFDGM